MLNVAYSKGMYCAVAVNIQQHTWFYELQFSITICDAKFLLNRRETNHLGGCFIDLRYTACA